MNPLPIPVKPLATITAFPETRSGGWRRELMTCRTYHEALTLAFRLVRELERREKTSPDVITDEHQLAFPWSRGG